MSISKVFLSRRNLLSLLSKLDRQAKGEDTFCTLIKSDNQRTDGFAQTMKEIYVTAVEDDVYYADRNAGVVHPSDDPGKRVCSYGCKNPCSCTTKLF